MNVLTSILAHSLEKAGFARKGATWYRKDIEAVCVLELQKSNWGKQHYINLGSAFFQFGTQEKPKEYECHIRGRLSGLLDDDSKLKSCLDLDSEMPLKQRQEYLTVVIQNKALPVLDMIQTLDGVRRFLELPKASRFLVSLKVKQAIGIST